jgi:hypothetical protein
VAEKSLFLCKKVKKTADDACGRVWEFLLPAPGQRPPVAGKFAYLTLLHLPLYRIRSPVWAPTEPSPGHGGKAMRTVHVKNNKVCL